MAIPTEAIPSNDVILAWTTLNWGCGAETQRKSGAPGFLCVRGIGSLAAVLL